MCAYLSCGDVVIVVVVVAVLPAAGHKKSRWWQAMRFKGKFGSQKQKLGFGACASDTLVENSLTDNGHKSAALGHKRLRMVRKKNSSQNTKYTF